MDQHPQSDLQESELNDLYDLFLRDDISLNVKSESDSDHYHSNSPTNDTSENLPKKRKNNPDAEEIARATEQSILELGIDPNSVEAKKARRQIRNRLSAQFHRNRKNEHARNLETDNTNLRNQIETLKRENKLLQEKIEVLNIENKRLCDLYNNSNKNSNIDSRKYSGSFTDSEHSSPNHSPSAPHGLSSQSAEYIMPNHYPNGSISPLSTSSISTSPHLSSTDSISTVGTSNHSLSSNSTIPSTASDFYGHSLVPVNMNGIPINIPSTNQYGLMGQSFSMHPSMTNLGTPLPSSALNPSLSHHNNPSLIHPSLLPPSISLQATFHPGHNPSQRSKMNSSVNNFAKVKNHAVLFSVLCVICLSHFIPSSITSNSPFKFITDFRDKISSQSTTSYFSLNLSENKGESNIGDSSRSLASESLESSSFFHSTDSLNVNKLNEKISHDFKKFFEELFNFNDSNFDQNDSRRLAQSDEIIELLEEDEDDEDLESEQEVEGDKSEKSADEKKLKKKKNLRNLTNSTSTININMNKLNKLIHEKMKMNFKSMMNHLKLNLNLNKTLSTLSSGTTNYSNSGLLTTSSSLFNGNFFEQDWFDFALSNEDDLTEKQSTTTWEDTPSQIQIEDGYVIVNENFSLSSSPSKKGSKKAETLSDSLISLENSTDTIEIPERKQKNTLSKKFSKFFNELEASINEAESNFKNSNFNFNKFFNKKVSKKERGDILTFTIPAKNIKIAKKSSSSEEFPRTLSLNDPSIELSNPDVATIGELFSTPSVPINQVPMIATESGLVPSTYLLNKEKEALKQQEIERISAFSLDQLEVEFKCVLMDTRVLEKKNN